MIGYSNGQFQVYANMTYAEEGSYSINVSITDQDNTIINATATAQVSDAPLSAGMPALIQATAGQPFNGPVGTFTDANSAASPSDFTAFINWGDGQISTGTISGSSGSYQVNSSHTYATAGAFPVQVTIYDAGGSQVVVNGTAQVAAGNGDGVVSGEVWQDANENGVLDSGESGLTGVTVNLDNPQGQTLMTTITDAYGNYAFDVDPALGSQFEIQVVIPSGENATTENASSSGIYSSIDTNGFSPVFALAPGGAANVNAGVAPAVNTYTWNPQGGSTSASQWQNWLLNGQKQTPPEGQQGSIPGTQPTDIVVFNRQVSNSAITWDGAATWKFATMQLGGTNKDGTPIANTQYTNVQTINCPGIELLGTTSLTTPLPTSGLNLNFPNLQNNTAGTFKIDGKASITNMVLSGSQNAQFQIAGGTTYLADTSGSGNPAYVEQIGVPFIVLPGGSVTDWGYNPLTFINSNLSILDRGSMTMFYSYGAGNPLINMNNGLTNEYVDVNGGTLTYKGSPGVTDSITVAVQVENGGTFVETAMTTQNPGGQLIVGSQQSFPEGSLWLTGAASSIQLSGGTTLTCYAGYYQDSGTLETMDLTTCTLQVGDKGQGTATIVGGSVAPGGLLASLYGDLVVKGNLDFGAAYFATIDGEETGINSTISVTGTMTIEDTATLEISVWGTLTGGNLWTILSASNQLQPFNPNNTNEALYGLHEKLNQPKGTYTLTY